MVTPHPSWPSPNKLLWNIDPIRSKDSKKHRERERERWGESDRLEIGDPQFDKRDDHRFPKDALYSLCKQRAKLRLAQDTKRYIAITHATLLASLRDRIPRESYPLLFPPWLCSTRSVEPCGGA